MVSLYRSGLPGSRVSRKVTSFTLELLRTAHKHYATENGHRLSRLKLALLIFTRAVQIRNVSAKKLVKQEAHYQSPGCSITRRFGGGVTGGHAGLNYVALEAEFPVTGHSNSYYQGR
jgi:hypothetical protein